MHFAGIWIVCQERLLYGILLIGAGCGRVMLIWRTKGVGTPSPGRSLPLYTINDWGTEGDDLPGVADDMTPEHLLPTPVVSPPKATPIPSELELLIQHLMGNDRPVQPAPTRRSGFTNMEVLVQHLLPATPPAREQPTRESGRWDWSTAVCFSGGKLSQAESQCPALDVTFPFLPPGD